MYDQWETWIAQRWNQLMKGKHLTVPNYLPHPKKVSGFSETSLAEYAGQLKDWVYQLEDGSRLHIHEFSDCLKIHIDKISPENGASAAIKHWILESKSFKIFLVIAIIAGIGTRYYFSKKSKNEV